MEVEEKNKEVIDLENEKNENNEKKEKKEKVTEVKLVAPKKIPE